MLTIVRQSVSLPATPATIYTMYLDRAQHGAFTGGGSVRIAAAPSTEWSAFDGRIQGRILALTPEHQIVQRRRRLDSCVGPADHPLARVPAHRSARVGGTQRQHGRAVAEADGGAAAKKR